MNDDINIDYDIINTPDEITIEGHRITKTDMIDKFKSKETSEFDPDFEDCYISWSYFDTYTIFDPESKKPDVIVDLYINSSGDEEITIESDKKTKTMTQDDEGWDFFHSLMPKSDVILEFLAFDYCTSNPDNNCHVGYNFNGCPEFRYKKTDDNGNETEISIKLD